MSKEQLKNHATIGEVVFLPAIFIGLMLALWFTAPYKCIKEESGYYVPDDSYWFGTKFFTDYDNAQEFAYEDIEIKEGKGCIQWLDKRNDKIIDYDEETYMRLWRENTYEQPPIVDTSKINF